MRHYVRHAGWVLTGAFNPIHLFRGVGNSYFNRAGLVFLGTGGVETNYQGVAWFLAECWAPLRKIHPNITLTIIGPPPDQFAMWVQPPRRQPPPPPPLPPVSLLLAYGAFSLTLNLDCC